MLSKPNFLVLGFWDSNMWKFLIVSKDITHDIGRKAIQVNLNRKEFFQWTHFQWTGFSFAFSGSSSKSEALFCWIKRRHHNYKKLVFKKLPSVEHNFNHNFYHYYASIIIFLLFYFYLFSFYHYFLLCKKHMEHWSKL